MSPCAGQRLDPTPARDLHPAPGRLNGRGTRGCRARGGRWGSLQAGDARDGWDGCPLYQRGSIHWTGAVIYPRMVEGDALEVSPAGWSVCGEVVLPDGGGRGDAQAGSLMPRYLPQDCMIPVHDALVPLAHCESPHSEHPSLRLKDSPCTCRWWRRCWMRSRASSAPTR